MENVYNRSTTVSKYGSYVIRLRHTVWSLSSRDDIAAITNNVANGKADRIILLAKNDFLL